jgi:vitamin B12 transporter
VSAQHRFGGWSSLKFDIGQSRDDSVDDYVPGSAADAPTSFASGRFESRTRQASLQADARLADAIQLLAGATRLDQAGGSTQYDPSLAGIQFTAFERRVDSYWLGAVGKLAGQQLQFNVRHDQYSDFGGATTGLAGWSTALVSNLRLAAQVSTAFRAPSFNDLYSPYGGNRNLEPERARTQEIGLRWSQPGLHAALNAYRTRIDQLIIFDQVTFVPNNIGRAAIDGAELQAGADRGAWSLGASVGLLHPRDADTGLPLLRRARYAVRADAAWSAQGWRVAGEWSRSGARDDFDINTNLRTELAPYSLARLTVQRTVWREVKVHLRVENLFNAHYQLVDGYNTLPRLVIGGIEARM